MHLLISLKLHLLIIWQSQKIRPKFALIWSQIWPRFEKSDWKTCNMQNSLDNAFVLLDWFSSSAFESLQSKKRPFQKDVVLTSSNSNVNAFLASNTDDTENYCQAQSLSHTSHLMKLSWLYFAGLTVCLLSSQSLWFWFWGFKDRSDLLNALNNSRSFIVFEDNWL